MTKTLTEKQFKLIQLISFGDFWDEGNYDDVTSLAAIAKHLDCSIESARGVLGSLVADELVRTDATDHAPDRPEDFWVYVDEEAVKLFESYR